MLNGNVNGPMLDAPDLPADVVDIVMWLLRKPQALEVWGLLGARVARIDCVAHSVQSLDLDSGHWLLVRIGADEGGEPKERLGGIVRFRRSHQEPATSKVT